MYRAHEIPTLILAGLILALALASCTVGKTESSADLGELPDMVMHNATYTVGSGSGEPLVVEAETITIYKSGNARTLLENLTFSRAPSVTGKCDSASVTNGNTIVTLSGNVVFASADDGVEISCGGLVWNQETGTLTTEGEVTVEYGDGTVVRAVGLVAVPGQDLYEFDEILEGTIEIE